MKQMKSTLVRRLAAAVAAAAVLLSVGVPVQATPQASSPVTPTWSVVDANGTTTEVAPAVADPAPSEAAAAEISPETASASTPASSPQTAQEQGSYSPKVVVGSQEASQPSGEQQPESSNPSMARGAKPDAATVKPEGLIQELTQLSEPVLAEDVTLTHLGTTEDGLEEYKLEATVALPAGDEEGFAAPLDDIKLMRTSGELDIREVTDPEVSGLLLDDATVNLFKYPTQTPAELPTELPADVVGDVIAFDVADTLLPQVSTFSATVLAAEPASEDVAWELYRGAMPSSTMMLRSVPEQPKTIDPKSDVPAEHARVVVQVAADALLNGRNNATQPGGRIDRVFSASPGAGAKLRLYAPLNNKAFGGGEVSTAWEEGASGETARAINQPWATCTADANGECVFDIPRGKGTDLYDYYWIVMEEASKGYAVQDWVRVGGSGNFGTAAGRTLRHAYPTPLLKAGETYYSGKSYSRRSSNRDGNGADWGSGSGSAFMHTQPSSQLGAEFGVMAPYRSSLGSFNQVRENQDLIDRCGLKVAMVIDTSGSMGRSMDVMNGVVKHVIDGLADTQTELGLYSFSLSSPGQGGGLVLRLPDNLEPQPLYTGAGREVLHAWREKLTAGRSAGATNWEAGLRQVADYNAKNSEAPYDVVYFVTDGNPTVHNNPSSAPDSNNTGTDTEFRDIEAAIAMANTVKSQGTRVIAVGIPPKWVSFWNSEKDRLAALEVSEMNLKAISGGVGAFDEPSLRAKDFARFTDQDVFKRALLNSLNTPCHISVERRFYQGDETDVLPTYENTVGYPEELSHSELEAWAFGATLTPETGNTETLSQNPDAENPRSPAGDDNKRAVFKLNGRTPYKQVAIRESADSIPHGWARMDAGPNGQRAQCFDLKGDPVRNTPLGAERTNDFVLDNVPMKGGIHCVVYYRKPLSTFTFQVGKVDAADGATALQGAEFKLEGLDATNKDIENATATTGADGIARWKDLKHGRYKLSEVTAPDGGFIALSKPVLFRVAHDGEHVKLYVLKDAEDATGTEVTTPDEILTFPVVNFTHRLAEQDSNTVEVLMNVANTKGGEMPETGGRGVLWPTLGGMLIMLAGLAMARRRATL